MKLPLIAAVAAIATIGLAVAGPANADPDHRHLFKPDHKDVRLEHRMDHKEFRHHHHAPGWHKGWVNGKRHDFRRDHDKHRFGK